MLFILPSQFKNSCEKIPRCITFGQRSTGLTQHYAPCGLCMVSNEQDRVPFISYEHLAPNVMHLLSSSRQRYTNQHKTSFRSTLAHLTRHVPNEHIPLQLLKNLNSRIFTNTSTGLPIINFSPHSQLPTSLLTISSHIFKFCTFAPASNHNVF
jgi:hypothetical protein